MAMVSAWIVSWPPKGRLLQRPKRNSWRGRAVPCVEMLKVTRIAEVRKPLPGSTTVHKSLDNLHSRKFAREASLVCALMIKTRSETMVQRTP